MLGRDTTRRTAIPGARGGLAPVWCRSSAGVRRGRGECAELAHLARGSSKLFSARHAENGPFYLLSERGTFSDFSRHPSVLVGGVGQRRGAP